MSYSVWKIAAVIGCVCSAIAFFTSTLSSAVQPEPGERVIVCGASSGIGELTAYIYAKSGARILLAARREKELIRVSDECRKRGATQVEYIVVDLSTIQATRDVIDRAVTSFNGVDVLILNHMVLDYSRWTEKSDLAFAEKQIAINLLSYVYLATHALTELEKSHGRIAVVSSGAGEWQLCTFRL